MPIVTPLKNFFLPIFVYFLYIIVYMLIYC
nr:MAG TPA: hypothetical protein [Caudoviricetes sp.]